APGDDVVDTLVATVALLLLVALEFLQGRQKSPCPPVPQSEVAPPAARGRLETHPRLHHPVPVGGGFVEGPPGRFDGCELAAQHVADLVAALECSEVPGEGDE